MLKMTVLKMTGMSRLPKFHEVLVVHHSSAISQLSLTSTKEVIKEWKTISKEHFQIRNDTKCEKAQIYINAHIQRFFPYNLSQKRSQREMLSLHLHIYLILSHQATRLSSLAACKN